LDTPSYSTVGNLLVYEFLNDNSVVATIIVIMQEY